MAAQRIGDRTHKRGPGTAENGLTDPLDANRILRIRQIDRIRHQVAWNVEVGRRLGLEERKKRSGQVNGTKITGIGIGQAYHSSGANGFDGLVRITPDGKVHIHSGAGNLGTYSYASTSRVVAEVLECPWDNCVVHRGDTRKGVPWTLGQFGSNTTFTENRANFAAANQAKSLLLRIGPPQFGGNNRK